MPLYCPSAQATLDVDTVPASLVRSSGPNAAVGPRLPQLLSQSTISSSSNVVQEWASCDKCHKWRRVINAPCKDMHWVCADAGRSCSDPAEHSDDDEFGAEASGMGSMPMMVANLPPDTLEDTPAFSVCRVTSTIYAHVGKDVPLVLSIEGPEGAIPENLEDLSVTVSLRSGRSIERDSQLVRCKEHRKTKAGQKKNKDETERVLLSQTPSSVYGMDGAHHSFSFPCSFRRRRKPFMTQHGRSRQRTTVVDVGEPSAYLDPPLVLKFMCASSCISTTKLGKLGSLVGFGKTRGTRHAQAYELLHVSLNQGGSRLSELTIQCRVCARPKRDKQARLDRMSEDMAGSSARAKRLKAADNKPLGCASIIFKHGNATTSARGTGGASVESGEWTGPRTIEVVDEVLYKDLLLIKQVLQRHLGRSEKERGSKRRKILTAIAQSSSDPIDTSGLRHWLADHGLERHLARLCENGFDDLELMAHLDESDLEAIGVEPNADRFAILAATRKLADVTPLRNREDPTKLLPPPNLFQLDIRSPHSPPASSGGVQAGDVAVSGTTRTPEEHGAADILANMDFGGFQKHVDVGGSAEY